jgi:hypothetical protein
MIELLNDALVFRFPEVHPDAELCIDFQRTLRIPDDDKTYQLPPGLGRFPLRHVDDHARELPAAWNDRGGVMLPMYQAEALWINFHSPTVDDRAAYPFVVKIAAGKINAVTGEAWEEGVHRDPQDYVVVPSQPWIDGYCVELGLIRQFVAMPLGAGYTAEEQITGEASWGGIQVAAYPMKREVFERRFPKTRAERRRRVMDELMDEPVVSATMTGGGEMGLGAGGRMHQKIYDDDYDFSDWDLRSTSRCFVHLANSMIWREITGSKPTTIPPTAKEYTRYGLPWFDYYSENPAVDGSRKLAALKTVGEIGKQKGELPLPENASVDPHKVVHLGKTPRDQVREW